MRTRATICIFARPPLPGRTKARLAAELGPEAAAAIARALLADTLAAARAVPDARVVLSVTEPFQGESGLDLEQWVQPSGGLGKRVEWTLRRALRVSPIALALGADTPGLAPSMLKQALRLLETHDAMVGPAADGGFYLLGVKACPGGLLDGIRWSGRTTCSDTVARLQDASLSCGFGVPWFDLDTAADLKRAAALLREDAIAAPHLAAELRRLDLSSAAS